MKFTRRLMLKLSSLLLLWKGSHVQAAEAPLAFGDEFPMLDSLAIGEWWNAKVPAKNAPPNMNVQRDAVIAFALYTHDRGVLKLTAQLFPLKPNEDHFARLEFFQDGKWTEATRSDIVYPGWSAHFRIADWDNKQNRKYRVRHGDEATFEGMIRRDPIDKDEIVIANMSCNSSRTTGMRPEIIADLLAHDPDLLFFAGDQTYRHTEHTAGWIEFGLQFRDVIRDRPTICIPDDHDVGHPNLWGENGKRALRKDGADGGYFYPAQYVNMVQRQQTWNLPDPVDAAPIEQGITVYFTNLRVGGIDFAILEDRKFKSGPQGKIPAMGPRPDHINDPSYDPATIDLPGLELLGKRQEAFLESWCQDWTGANLKVVLSQTAFCGAVHMHGTEDGRLLADLDCNGWPQTPRRRALQSIRRAHAIHLCGDQHLAVVTKQGLDEFGDGPYEFTSPSLVNTIYGRWWHPLDEQAGPNPIVDSPLPWTGDFEDGLGNKITMLAYANPTDIKNEKQRADGFGIVRFRKSDRTATIQCWPRFNNAASNEREQFPGWPIQVNFADNDGRKPVAYLPRFEFQKTENPVVQVIEEATGEILYTIRVPGKTFQPPVYAAGNYTVKFGHDSADQFALEKINAGQISDVGVMKIDL